MAAQTGAPVSAQHACRLWRPLVHHPRQGRGAAHGAAWLHWTSALVGEAVGAAGPPDRVDLGAQDGAVGVDGGAIHRRSQASHQGRELTHAHCSSDKASLPYSQYGHGHGNQPGQSGIGKWRPRRREWRLHRLSSMPSPRCRCRATESLNHCARPRALSHDSIYMSYFFARQESNTLLYS